MKRLLLAALLFAQPLAAQRFTPLPPRTPIPPRGGATLALPPDPGLLPSVPVREGSDACAEAWGRTVTIPRPEAVRCYRVKAMEYVVAAAQRNEFRPGPKSVSLTYPGVTFAVWPVHVFGAVAGVPQWVCAAGIGSNPIVVSLAQDWRTLWLVAWETANNVVALQLDRYDLGDGAVVEAATNYAKAECPAY